MIRQHGVTDALSDERKAVHRRGSTTSGTMQKIDSSPRFQRLPAGRLLYRLADELHYVVVRHGRAPGVWLVVDGWTAESEAAGPFHPHDILRALRLASTFIPQGCELGPWQRGLGLFERSKLPFHPSEWSRVEPSWLDPSVSRYSEQDIDCVVNETCCAPARDMPRVDWRAVAANGAEVRALVRARCPDLDLAHVGALHRAWNAHPAGSLLLAESELLSGAFIVVDCPPA